MVPLIGMACSLTDDGAGRMGTTYVRAVQEAGGLVVGISPLTPPEQVERLVSVFAGILLPGGPDVDPRAYGEEILPVCGSIEPLRDRLELALARWALQEKRPILGICRGMQVMNVAAGGSLYQDIASQTEAFLQHRQQAPRWYVTHGIDIEPESRLAQIFGTASVPVNSFHHQAVKGLAPGLRIAAWAPDDIVEAVEAIDHPFAVGVQWHPEDLVPEEPVQRRLFAAFVEAVERVAAGIHMETAGEQAG